MRDVFHDPGWAKLALFREQFPKVAADLAAVDSAADPDRLPPTAFADPVARRFPVHEKTAAVASYLYARDAGGAVRPEVMQTIVDALDVYGVPADAFEPVVAKVAAEPEDHFVFPERRAWPMRTAGELKTAERRLHVEALRLLPEARVEAYGRIYKRAAELGVACDPGTARYAGMVDTDPRRLADALRARGEAAAKHAADKTVGEAVREKLAEVAAAVLARPADARSRATRVKLAAVVHELDRRAGLVPFYDREIADPVATVFNTEKRAYADDIELASRSVSAAKLAALPLTFFRDALGADFADELKTAGNRADPAKVAAIIPTLPGDMKRNLEVALRSAGV